MARHIIPAAFRRGPLITKSAGLAATLAGAVALARQRQRILQLEASHDRRDAELAHLVDKRLPALDAAAHGEHDPGPLRPETDPGFTRSLTELLTHVTELTHGSAEHAGRTAQHTMTGVLDTVRALAAEQHVAVNTMQHRHEDPEVLADLYAIDHASAQLSRRLKAYSVLTGAWIGQQREATALVEIIRGAQSQIRHYQRVTVADPPQAEADELDRLGIVSRAVEPVVLSIAELLDNATRYSPPYATVDVGVRQAHHGVAITIDDAGVGMPREEQQRAARLLARDSVELAELGDPPRIGMAVIGMLTSRYNFQVTVDAPPAYGGVRAVVFVPNEMLTRVESTTAGHEAPADTTESNAAAAPATRTPSGLPKRRCPRRRPRGRRRGQRGRGPDNARCGSQRREPGRLAAGHDNTRGRPRQLRRVNAVMSMQSVRRPDLQWMLEDVVLLPGVNSAVVLARDGLVITASEGVTSDDADRWAACLSSLRGASHAAAEFNSATAQWQQTLVEYDTGYLVLISAGQHAYLGVSTTKNIDMGPATKRFHSVVTRLGSELSTEPRGETTP